VDQVGAQLKEAKVPTKKASKKKGTGGRNAASIIRLSREVRARKQLDGVSKNAAGEIDLKRKKDREKHLLGWVAFTVCNEKS